MKRILATAKFIDVPAQIADDFLVLTPNSAAAARLGVSHRSLRSVADKILNRAGIGIATTLAAHRALRLAVAAVIPDRDPADEAARFKRIVATVLRDGHRLETLRTSGLERAHQLADIVARYCDDLSAQGLVPADAALWKARELIRDRSKIFVYGYFRARDHDIRFIDSLAGDGSVYILPSGPESIFASANRSLEWLLANGWEESVVDFVSSSASTLAERFAAGNSEPSATEANGRAFAYADLDAEVRAVLSNAKQMIVEGTRPQKIAVVCRKASDYEESVRTVAKEYGLRVSSRSKKSLAETKVGNYAALILEAVESDLEFTITARLLNHPYGPQLSEESWTAARRWRARGIAGWKAAGVDLEDLGADEDRTLNDWIRWLLNMIPLSTVRERSALSAAELLAYETFREALDELKRSDDGSQIDHSTFAAALRELLETFNTIGDPASGGIGFHQPHTIIGGEFDHVFVVGMAEGMLPATTNEDTVVDFHEQRQLEKCGIKFDPPIEFPRWEALSFYYILLAARQGVTFSYPRVVGIDEKIASPFFERLGIEPVAGFRNAISSPQEELKFFLRQEHETDDRVLQAARRQFATERRRESSEAYDDYDGVIGIPIHPETRVWSASQFTKIGQCPFQWFAQKALGLSATQEGESDLKPTVTGSLYHKTLQIAVEKAKREPDFRAAVIRELEPAFLLAEADEEIRVTGLPNWQHRRGEHLAILKKAVESPEFIGDGYVVNATERPVEANWRGFRVRGKIDRVDETPEGRLTVLDYKTGTYVGKVKDENGELKIDIQLPIYSEILDSLYPDRVDSGRYFSLRQTKTIKQTAADLEDFSARVKKILEDGDFAVDPDVNKKSCNYCDYDAVCRQGQRNVRKQKSK